MAAVQDVPRVHSFPHVGIRRRAHGLHSIICFRGRNSQLNIFITYIFDSSWIFLCSSPILYCVLTQSRGQFYFRMVIACLCLFGSIRHHEPAGLQVTTSAGNEAVTQEDHLASSRGHLVLSFHPTRLVSSSMLRIRILTLVSEENTGPVLQPNACISSDLWSTHQTN